MSEEAKSLKNPLNDLLNDQIKQQIAGFVMGAVSKFISDLIAKLFSNKPSTPDPPLKPVIPSPGDGDEDTPVPQPTGRIFSGLRLSLKGVKRDGGHIDHEKIKNGEDPAVAGDVLNFDIDPLDQFGNEITPGSPELKQLLFDPENPYDPSTPNDGQESRMRIQYAMGNFSFAINGTRWQYGCNPNVKVPRDLKNVDQNLVFSAFAANAQNKSFASNAVRVRIKDTRK